MKKIIPYLIILLVFSACGTTAPVTTPPIVTIPVTSTITTTTAINGGAPTTTTATATVNAVTPPNGNRTKAYTLDLSQPSPNAIRNTQGTRRLSVWSGDLLQFEIINGNPFKYNYAINSSFLNFFDGSAENFIETYKKSLDVPVPKPPVTAEETATAKAKDKASASTILGRLNSNNPAIKKAAISSSNQYLIAKSQLFEPTQDITTLKRSTQNAINTLSAYTPFATNSYAYLVALDPSLIVATDLETDKSYLSNAAIQLLIACNDAEFRVKLYSSELKGFDNLDINDYKTKRTAFRTEAITLARHYRDFKIDAAKFKEIDKSTTDNLELVNTSIKELLSSMDTFDDVQLTNYTFPTDANGKNIDAIEITVSKFNKKTPQAIDSHTYNIWMVGGIKLDFSAGLFVTTLKDREYYTRTITLPVTDGTIERKVIFEKDKGKLNFGVGSTFNISHRSAAWANPTLNFGGLVTTDQQFQFLAGLGVILGKEERVIVSSGCSMGFVKHISDEFIADGTQLYDLGTSTEIPTGNKFDFGFYFGLTYNFSGAKKKPAAD